MAHFRNQMILCPFILLFNLMYTKEVKLRYYPRYHLAPPGGVLNDFNGFSLYNDEYYLFYEYNPNFKLDPGVWGYAKSPDLIHWHHLPIAMAYFTSGVSSGTALDEDGKTDLKYNCNPKYRKQEPDHEPCLLLSENGDKIIKYKTQRINEKAEQKPNFRDPKVWKHSGKYYMVLQNLFENSTSDQIILYESINKIYWRELSLLHESKNSLDYKWQRPDFFGLNGRYVLLFSLQAIVPQKDQNVYQCGYIVGNFDYQKKSFTSFTKFKVLDHGHDFYATQTVIDKLGQRVLIALFKKLEKNADYPEAADGFSGQMTLPRILTLSKDHHLLQKPVKSIAAARRSVLRKGVAKQGENVTLKYNTGEINITAAGDRDFELLIKSSNAKMNLNYSNLSKTVTLDRGGNDSVRRAVWQPQGRLRWTIYVDASSVELFCGDGEITISSRFFPRGPITVLIGNHSEALEFNVKSLMRTVPRPN